MWLERVFLPRDKCFCTVFCETGFYWVRDDFWDQCVCPPGTARYLGAKSGRGRARQLLPTVTALLWSGPPWSWVGRRPLSRDLITRYEMLRCGCLIMKAQGTESLRRRTAVKEIGKKMAVNFNSDQLQEKLCIEKWVLGFLLKHNGKNLLGFLFEAKWSCWVQKSVLKRDAHE